MISWLSRFFSKEKTFPTDMHQLVNEELGLYFSVKPSDPIWKTITPEQADLIQTGFLRIWQSAELEKYHSTNELPVKVIDAISEISNTIGEKNNLNPIFTILVSHQYVDADQMLRQMYRERWVAFMAERATFAQPPESYIDYLKAQYFS